MGSRDSRNVIMPDKALQELKAHGLRKTWGRQQVLIYFRERKTAVSHGEISKAFAQDIDRASLYRILHDFEQKGLIHKVPDDEVSVKYAYCGSHCSTKSHSDQHLHFKCDNCHETFCLEEQKLPTLQLPPGFLMQSTEVLVHGTCRACA